MSSGDAAPGTDARPVLNDPALRFAATPDEPPLTRGLRMTAALARAPRAALAILGAGLSGKRVRARQARAALLGLDHRGLWCDPAEQVRLLAAGLASEAASPEVPISPGAVEVDLRWAETGDLSGAAPVIVFLSAGHTLLPGAEALIRAAFASEPGRQALYGDALLVAHDGAAMPLLRPAFDPGYLMAVDYVGPVLALRRSGLEAITLPADLPASLRATDLILRLAHRFGPDAIGHLPRLLSRSNFDRLAIPKSGPEGEGRRARRRDVIRNALDRAGHSDVALETGPGGVLGLRHPLPPEAPLVSLIVPTRDRLDLVRPCIASLLDRTDWPAREILICDNGSAEPESLAYFADLEARGLARIVACPGPFDFAAMNNVAARVARGRVLAFVNNDVEARHPDWLERLVREALRPEIGAVGAKLIDREGRIQHGGVLLGPGGLVTHAHRFFPADAPGYLGGLSATRAVSAVTAACLVVEADKFAKVGGFDGEAFAVDFNDVDLCLRLDAAGYRTLFVPSAVLNHFEAASRRWTPEARARHDREVAALRRRWGPLLAQDLHYHPGFDPDLGSYARLRRDWSGTGPVSSR